MRTVFLAVIVGLLPISAHAQIAPMPEGIAVSGDSTVGIYAHGTSEVRWTGETGEFIRQRRELCAARGYLYAPPGLEAWLYAIEDERVALIERSSHAVVDADGCSQRTGSRRFVNRRVREGGSWRSGWDDDLGWPGPFRGSRIRCSRYSECTTNRDLGVPVRCSSAGNGFFIDFHCAVTSGPARGIATAAFSWVDDSPSEYSFTVDDLRVRAMIDRAVFLTNAEWCTHRTNSTSPCAPDRPGELVDPLADED